MLESLGSPLDEAPFDASLFIQPSDEGFETGVLLVARGVGFEVQSIAGFKQGLPDFEGVEHELAADVDAGGGFYLPFNLDHRWW